MKITTEVVKHVASLARLRIEESDVENVRSNMEKVLGHIEELSNVNVADVSPMFSPIKEWAHFYESKSPWREDVIGDSLPVDQVLLNAPVKKENQFVVDVVIEEN